MEMLKYEGFREAADEEPEVVAVDAEAGWEEDGSVVIPPSEGGDPMLFEYIDVNCDLTSWQDGTPDDTGMGWLETLDEQREEEPPIGDMGEKT